MSWEELHELETSNSIQVISTWSLFWFDGFNAKKMTSRSKSGLPYVPWQWAFENNIVSLGYGLQTIDHDHMISHIILLTTFDHVCKMILILSFGRSQITTPLFFWNFQESRNGDIHWSDGTTYEWYYILDPNIETSTENVINLSTFYDFEEFFFPAISSMTKQQIIRILLRILGIRPFIHLKIRVTSYPTSHCSDRCPRRFLGIVGWDPIISNINRLHIDIFWFFLY